MTSRRPGSDAAGAGHQRDHAPGAGHEHPGMPGGHDDHGHDDHGHDGDEPVDEAAAAAVADAIWKVDNVELTTVGIDVGSATSHLLFSRLHLRRQGDVYSSRFVVVSRVVLHRSEILLTPYLPDGLIDAAALGRFIHASYADAGLTRDAVDAGAVILTGVALERANARSIAELFAADGGRFVCATAGHNLEALLAAHGSGAVARSRGGEVVLSVDVGGGTTKLALCVGGRVAATMAIVGGARLLAVEDGAVSRIEPAMADLAAALGIELAIGGPISDVDRRRLATALADRISAAVAGDVEAGVVLAGGLPATPRPDSIVLSGGVAEYVGRADAAADHGDLGPDLAAATMAALAGLAIPVHPSAERIRATVIGASQFAVQLSGNTIHLSGSVELPIHGLPVVAIEVADDPFPDAASIGASIERRSRQLDLADRDDGLAIAIDWTGEPRYDRLRGLAEGILAAHRRSARRDRPVVLALVADLGASLGGILEHELGFSGGVIAIDGLDLADLDFIDIGARILPANVVPVVVKSLVFPEPGSHERPRILGAA